MSETNPYEPPIRLDEATAPPQPRGATAWHIIGNALWFAVGHWLAVLVVGLFSVYLSPPPSPENQVPPVVMILWPLFAFGYALVYAVPFGVWLCIRAILAPAKPARRSWIALLLGAIFFIVSTGMFMGAILGVIHLTDVHPAALGFTILAAFGIQLLLAAGFAEICFRWQRFLTRRLETEQETE